MASVSPIKRFSLIIEKLSSGQFPSLEEMREFLSAHEIEISRRTLQRDIESIRTDFGIDILYDRIKDGYYIDRQGSFDLDAFLKFLEIAVTSEIFLDSLKESKEALKKISFEYRGEMKGIQHLKPFFQAIRENRIVRFQHTNYLSGKKKNYSLSPYLLREYQGRWYVVGYVSGADNFFSFGLDRIENVVVTDSLFKADPDKDPAEYFENIIGIYYSEEPPEEIILSFTPDQANYIRTLPFHHSQEILCDNDNELLCRYLLIPNYELTQKILMLGNKVKVISPEWLKAEIKTILKSSLGNY